MERFEKHGLDAFAPCPTCLAPAPICSSFSTAFLSFFFLIKSACKPPTSRPLKYATFCLGIPPWSSNNWVPSFSSSFLAVPGYMWILVLSSPTRGWAHAPALEGRGLTAGPPGKSHLQLPSDVTSHRDHPVGSRCPKHHHPISLYLYFHCFIHTVLIAICHS